MNKQYRDFEPLKPIFPSLGPPLPLLGTSIQYLSLCMYINLRVTTTTPPVATPLKGKLLSPRVDGDRQHNQLRGEQRSKFRLIPMLSILYLNESVVSCPGHTHLGHTHLGHTHLGSLNDIPYVNVDKVTYCISESDTCQVP